MAQLSENSVCNLSFGGVSTIGKSQRMDGNNKLLTPSPSAYDLSYGTIQRKKIPGPKWSQVPKQNIFKDSEGPAPGSYEIDSNIGKGQKIVMNKAPRELHDISSSKVGPGQYVVMDQYVKKNTPFISFMSRHEEPDNQMYKREIGPGKYEVSMDLSQKKSFGAIQNGFSSGDKDSIYKQGDILTNPGPGNYEVNISTIQSTPSHKFSKQKKFNSINQNDLPGPGSFEIKSTLINSNSHFTLKGRLDIQDQNFSKQVPGPGYYDSNMDIINKSTPAIKIGSSKRLQIKQDNLPGPGQYGSIFLKSYEKFQSGKGFGYAGRSVLQQIDDIPGPGEYDYGYQFGKGPGVIIPGSGRNQKFQYKKKEETPGPGQYNLREKNNQNPDTNNQFGKMGVKTTLRNPSESNPGPGAYEISQYSMSPKISFGKEKKMPKNNRDFFQISPASYDIKTNFAALPKYLLLQQQQKENKKE